ncbi:MAG TPA: type II secretion system protein GspM [Geminicoccaceae bacterium]|nr:type II secretion system protein GspM [Geminicoccaceae bacterium]
MIAALPPSARRALALLILALVLAGAAALVWLPFAIVGAQDATLVRLDQRIAALEARLETREQLLAERRLLARSTELDQMLLVGATPALAGAELQRIVTGLIERGGSVESVQALEPEERAPFVRIMLRASFTSTLVGLRGFLHAVEAHAPVLLVDSLSISEAASLPAGDGEEARLRAVVEVFGYARAPAAPQQG